MECAEATTLLMPLLAELPSEVVSVYLYGSTVRGNAKRDSDLDLAFWRRTTSAATMDEQPYLIAAALEARARCEVDLVELNRAPSDLVHEVLRDGVLLLDRDPAFRVRCEVAARSAYLDLLPVLRSYRAPRNGP